MILISFFTHYVKSSKQLNCSSNSRGFTLFTRYSQAQDLYSSCLQDRFEDLPKLVEDILQTLVSTSSRGALRMVQGIQAFIGVGGEWLADVSKIQRVNVAKKCILEHFLAWNGYHMLGAKGMDEILSLCIIISL